MTRDRLPAAAVDTLSLPGRRQAPPTFPLPRRCHANAPTPPPHGRGRAPRRAGRRPRADRPVPAAGRRPAEAGTELPADLAMVPADALGFVHVRLADVWKHDALKEYRRIVEKAGPRALAALDAQFVPPPSTIDRVTAVALPPARGPPRARPSWRSWLSPRRSTRPRSAAAYLAGREAEEGRRQGVLRRRPERGGGPLPGRPDAGVRGRQDAAGVPRPAGEGRRRAVRRA